MLTDHILFKDSEALVLDKPAGLAVDPPRDGSLSLANHALVLRLGNREDPAPVHRLDRDTSGCLLLARSVKAHRRLSRAFENRRVVKRYIAIVDGVPEAPDGVVDMALGKTSTQADGWRIVPDRRGKASLTRWRVLAQAGGRALLLLEPETGRTHQLRVHMASGIGLSITGDSVYGRAHPGGMMLHAATLNVPRETKAAIEAVAPFPARFAALGFALPDRAYG